MDSLPDELLEQILRFAAQFAPVLHAVCRRWHWLAGRLPAEAAHTLGGLAEAGCESLALAALAAGPPAPWLTAAEYAGICQPWRAKDYAGRRQRMLVAAMKAGRTDFVGRCLAADPCELRELAELVHAAAANGEERFVDRFTGCWRCAAAALIGAAAGGHVRLVKKYRRINGSIYEAMLAACRGGHEPVMQLLAESCFAADHTSTDVVIRRLQNALQVTARNGHLQCVKLCQQWGAQNLEDAMVEAAGGGHEATFRYCRHAANLRARSGEREIPRAGVAAARSGHLGLVRSLIEEHKDYPETFNPKILGRSLCEAAWYGHTPVVQYLLGLGVRHGAAARNAAKRGHVEAVRQLVDPGGASLSMVLSDAAGCDQAGVMCLCRDLGARRFEAAALQAARRGCEVALRLCRAWGARNLRACRDVAATSMLAELCTRWLAEDHAADRAQRAADRAQRAADRAQRAAAAAPWG